MPAHQDVHRVLMARGEGRGGGEMLEHRGLYMHVLGLCTLFQSFGELFILARASILLRLYDVVMWD